MDQIQFSNGKVFNLAQNGVQMMGDKLVLKIASSDFNLVEASVESDTITQMMADGTKVSVYKDYSRLVSINKLFDQTVDHKTTPREVIEEHFDEETQKNIEVVTTVYDVKPVKSDVCIVTLTRPTVEQALEAQAAQVTEVQAMLKELMLGE